MFSQEFMDQCLITIAESTRGEEIRAINNGRGEQKSKDRWFTLISAQGSQTLINILYSRRRREEVADYRTRRVAELGKKSVQDLCVWGHECPPTKYCPRARAATATRPAYAGRCSVCVSSRWERIIYALVQMTGLTAEKYYVEGRELDIYIPELKKAIEYNGEQHYRAGLFTPDLTHRLWKDQEKLFASQRANIKLLFVRFDDPSPIETVLEFLQH